jgi:hypothetical protein
MKFDGTSWVSVGPVGFTSGTAVYTTLAFSSSDQPYLAYWNENTFRVMVMQFDGNNWVNVGDSDISPREVVGSLSFAFNPSNGQPYVAFNDSANLGTTMKKFNGTDWVNVGLPGFSASDDNYLSLAFSPSEGQPYVAYQDYSNSQKVTVMKYDSVYIGINEQQESRLFLYPNPAIDKITIEIPAVPANSQLSIMNLDGQELITHQITQPTTTIDVSNLPSGVYFVRLTNDKTVEVGKFIKQ